MGALAETVHVFDKDGTGHAFGPDDEVPAWAAKLITNPKAWVEAPASDTAEPEKAPVPPRGGPGSGAEAWAEYAKANGFDVPADASREEIIEALDGEGIATA